MLTAIGKGICGAVLQSQVDLRRRPKQVRLPCVPIPINVPGAPPTAAEGTKRE
jgi:hypothetical protein